MLVKGVPPRAPLSSRQSLAYQRGGARGGTPLQASHRSNVSPRFAFQRLDSTINQWRDSRELFEGDSQCQSTF